MASQWREATLLGTSTLSTLFYTWRYHFHHHHQQQQHQHSQRHHHYHDPHHHDHHYHRIKEICYIGLRQGLAHLVPAALGGGQGGQVRHRVGRHHCHAQNDKTLIVKWFTNSAFRVAKLWSGDCSLFSRRDQCISRVLLLSDTLWGMKTLTGAGITCLIVFGHPWWGWWCYA